MSTHNNENLSPSIQEALRRKPELAEARPLQPGPPSRMDALDVFDEALLEDEDALPYPETPTSSAFERIAEEERKRLDEEARRKLGISLSAIEAAGHLDGPGDLSDDIDASLGRVDIALDRAKRYRRAMGGGNPAPLTHMAGCKIDEQDHLAIVAMAKLRGESQSEVIRYLIRCGLILADERRRRFELNIAKKQLKKHVTGMIGDRDIWANKLKKKPSPQTPAITRYIDPSSPFLSEEALQMNPFLKLVKEHSESEPPKAPEKPNPFKDFYG